MYRDEEPIRIFYKKKSDGSLVNITPYLARIEWTQSASPYAAPEFKWGLVKVFCTYNFFPSLDPDLKVSDLVPSSREARFFIVFYDPYNGVYQELPLSVFCDMSDLSRLMDPTKFGIKVDRTKPYELTFVVSYYYVLNQRSKLPSLRIRKLHTLTDFMYTALSRDSVFHSGSACFLAPDPLTYAIVHNKSYTKLQVQPQTSKYPIDDMLVCPLKTTYVPASRIQTSSEYSSVLPTVSVTEALSEGLLFSRVTQEEVGKILNEKRSQLSENTRSILELVSTIRSFIESLFGSVRQMIDETCRQILNVLKEISDAFFYVIDYIGDLLSSVVDTFVQSVRSLINTLESMLSNAVGLARTLIRSIIDLLTTLLSGPTSAAEALVRCVYNISGLVISSIGGLLSRVSDLLILPNTFVNKLIYTTSSLVFWERYVEEFDSIWKSLSGRNFAMYYNQYDRWRTKLLNSSPVLSTLSTGRDFTLYEQQIELVPSLHAANEEGITPMDFFEDLNVRNEIVSYLFEDRSVTDAVNLTVDSMHQQLSTVYDVVVTIRDFFVSTVELAKSQTNDDELIEKLTDLQDRFTYEFIPLEWYNAFVDRDSDFYTSLTNDLEQYLEKHKLILSTFLENNKVSVELMDLYAIVTAGDTGLFASVSRDPLEFNFYLSYSPLEAMLFQEYLNCLQSYYPHLLVELVKSPYVYSSPLGTSVGVLKKLLYDMCPCPVAATSSIFYWNSDVWLRFRIYPDTADPDWRIDLTSVRESEGTGDNSILLTGDVGLFTLHDLTHAAESVRDPATFFSVIRSPQGIINIDPKFFISNAVLGGRHFDFDPSTAKGIIRITDTEGGGYKGLSVGNYLGEFANRLLFRGGKMAVLRTRLLYVFLYVGVGDVVEICYNDLVNYIPRYNYLFIVRDKQMIYQRSEGTPVLSVTLYLIAYDLLKWQERGTVVSTETEVIENLKQIYRNTVPYPPKLRKLYSGANLESFYQAVKQIEKR